MLVYFSVENYKSINERLELNMRTAPRLRRFSHHATTPTKDRSLKVLRNAVIYGANASGKSNIVKAIKAAQNYVTGDSSRTRSKIKIEPFKITENVKKDTSFYFEFVYSKALFGFGFSVANNIIQSEYLYHLDKSNDFCIYEREITSNNSYKFKSDITIENGFPEDEVEDLKRLLKYSSNEQLFLREAHDKDYVEKLNDIGNLFYPPLYFFLGQLIVIFPDTFYGGLGSDLSTGENSCEYLNLLSNFDTGVSDIQAKKVNSNIFPEDLLERVESQLNEMDRFTIVNFNGEEYRFELTDDNELSISKIIALHKLPNGKLVQFDLNDESDGTRRIIDLLPALSGSETSDEDRSFTYVIDEFDRSLHPNLSRAFIDAFLNDGISNPQDQLIVTTHESSILDNDLLRRDEIWFVQKEDDHSSSLYSLNDYSPRFDKDIRNAYLSGIYGAVPHLNKFKR